MSSNIHLKSQLDAKDLLLLDSEVRSQGKSMVVAYVLLIFLGGFGAHRFYLGRTGSAIAQLILTITVIGAIVSIIWVLVDLFLTHTMVNEKNSEVEQRVLHQIMRNRA